MPSERCRLDLNNTRASVRDRVKENQATHGIYELYASKVHVILGEFVDDLRNVNRLW